jgi:hypothetical protein
MYSFYTTQKSSQQGIQLHDMFLVQKMHSKEQKHVGLDQYLNQIQLHQWVFFKHSKLNMRPIYKAQTTLHGFAGDLL